MLAGGQSLLPLLNARRTEVARLVDLGRVEALRELELSNGALAIGAGVTQRRLERDDAAAAAHPLLRRALGFVGNVTIRNRGTVCGSLAHADPFAELPCVAVALEASVSLSSTTGTREVSVEDFLVGPHRTARRPDEVITSLRIPAARPRTASAFRELSARAHDVAVVGTAVVVSRATDGRVVHCRVVCTGAGPTPIRATAAECVLVGSALESEAIAQATALAGSGAQFVTDVRASAEYRARTLPVLVRRCLEEVAGTAGSDER